MFVHCIPLAAAIACLIFCGTSAHLRRGHINAVAQVCSPDNWLCDDGNGCVQKAWLCDNEADCKDGSDEKNCLYRSKRKTRGLVLDSAELFECKDGRQIEKKFVCDGDTDCADGSDEKHCMTRKRVCSVGEILCADGSRCLPKGWACDGSPDCDDESDEAACEDPPQCGPHQSRCSMSKRCIPDSWFCDGHVDCKEGDDELNCTSTTDSKLGCSSNEFDCGNGQCVDSNKLCDKSVDCLNGADESDCEKNNCSSSNCLSPRICIPTSSGHTCACPSGTVLEDSSCSDVDECSLDRNECTQNCINSFGSFRCTCEENYQLEPDLRSCKALHGSPILFYTEGSSIHGLHVGENLMIEIATHLHGPTGVSYDPNSQQVVWTEIEVPTVRTRIAHFQPTSAQPSAPRTIVSTGLQQPEGIAVDWLNQLIYYSDLKSGNISACNFDGVCTEVLNTTGSLRGIALHPLLRLMFFTDWNNDRPRLERAGMDGSKRHSIITTDIKWPNGVAIDRAQNVLYWVDGGLNKIEKCNFDGTNRKIIIEFVKQPFAIAVFENSIYWSDWSSNAIQSADKITGKNRKVIAKHRTIPRGVCLYHPLMVNASAANPCKSAKCSHLCLLSPSSRGYQCACPRSFYLSSNQRTCIAIGSNKNRPFKPMKVFSASVTPPTTFATTTESRFNYKYIDSSELISAEDVESRIMLALQCGSDEYKCETAHCVNRGTLCDGIRDCPMGDDEEDCDKGNGKSHPLLSKDGCPVGKFSCDGGQQCISQTWVCDGQIDCRTGEDERSCHVTAVLPVKIEACTSEQFRCHSKECIQRTSVCDGQRDCADGSDEDGWCSGCKEANGGCQFQCVDTPDGPYCVCPGGMVLADDGHQCEDFNECLSDNVNDCDHFCSNEYGTYRCSCAYGYKLENNRKTCTPEERRGQLLYSVGHEIRNVPLFDFESTTTYGVMMETRRGKIVGLDYSIRDNRFYYTDHDGGSIYAHNTDNVCLVEGLYYPQNVAVDWITGNIYFTNDRPGAIGLCTSDGRFCKTLIRHNILRPRGLALHPRKGYLFWSDWGDDPRIERTYLDGSNRISIVNDKLGWPNSLSIDYIHDALYWIDAQLKIVERCDLDGGNRVVIMSKGLHHPFDLVVFDHRIFWSDWSLKSVLVADQRNVTTRKILNTVQVVPYGLTISSPIYQQQNLPNPCDLARCSHICALGPSSSATCLCPDHYKVNEATSGCYYPHREKREDSDDSVVDYSPRLCSSTFLDGCKTGICRNGGECQEIEENRVECRCREGYSGLFCEVGTTSKLVIVSPVFDAANVNQQRVGWLIGLLVGLVFAVTMLGLSFYVLRRSSVYEFRMKGHAGYFFKPSILFRKRITSLEDDYKQKILDHEHGVNPDAVKFESFQNPLYEDLRGSRSAEVHRPLLQSQSASSPDLKSQAGSDSDADSAFEFSNTGSIVSVHESGNSPKFLRY